MHWKRVQDNALEKSPSCQKLQAESIWDESQRRLIVLGAVVGVSTKGFRDGHASPSENLKIVMLSLLPQARSEGGAEGAPAPPSRAKRSTI